MRLSPICLALLLVACPPGGEPPADDDDAVDDFDAPDWCPAPEDGRQQVDDTDAAPYLVSHPDSGLGDAPVVLFMPGGYGNDEHATGTWDAFLQGAVDGLSRYRVVMPFATDGDFRDEWQRAEDVLDEVLTCFGGDPAELHLIGHSNGGWEALNLLQAMEPGTFATISVAPGSFDDYDPDRLVVAQDRALVVVGENDDPAFIAACEGIRDALEAVGMDVTFEVIAGMGHTPEAGWSGGDALLFGFFDGP